MSQTAGVPTEDEAAPDAAPTGIPALIGRIFQLKPVRVFFQYAGNGGPLMASGMAYAAIFAVFAGLVVGFAVVGLVLQGDVALQRSVISSLSEAVPGLIDPGDGSGAINPDDLLNTGGFAELGIVGLAGLLFTALNFLASAREAVRRIFTVAQPTTFFLLLKLKDLGLAILFGAAVIVSTALSAASTAALGFVLDLLGVGADSAVGTVLGRILGLIVVLALDTAVLAALYRILAGIPIPRKRLFGGALVGGIGLGILKALGNTLLGGATNNPLLASFAIIIGLLIFFNLVCQVILICASWIAVGMDDSGIAADPEAAEAERAEAERIAELERIAAEARTPLLTRLWNRVRGRGSVSTGSTTGVADRSSAPEQPPQS